MGLNYRLAHNNVNKRQSSASSHSYDDLSDQFEPTAAGNSNRLACSRNGYAKILPRKQAAPTAPDMWAVKAVPAQLPDSSSLMLPRYFFESSPSGGYNSADCHNISSNSMLLGVNNSHTLGQRASTYMSSTPCVANGGGCNSAPSGKKRSSKYHKIGPRTLGNPPTASRLVSPYSRVPIRIGSNSRGDREEEEEEEEGGEGLVASTSRWERTGSVAVSQDCQRLRQPPNSLCLGLSSPAQVLSLQSAATAATVSGEGTIFKSLRRLTNQNSSGGAVRNSGDSSCSDGSSTSTTATAPELGRLQPPPLPPIGGRPASRDCGDLLEDDAYSNDDYVDMTSDAGDDGEGDESQDENYKALTDRALNNLAS
jgi:hypothetical protein